MARTVRGNAWLLATLIVVIGTVLAARSDAELALVLRTVYAAVVLALASFVAWLIDRYAARLTRQ